MASPHVAGAAALYLAANPTATPQQVRDALVNNATPNKVTNPGTGSPNRLLYTGFIGGTPPPDDTTAPTTSITAPTGGATLIWHRDRERQRLRQRGRGPGGLLPRQHADRPDTTSPYSVSWNTAAW